MAAEYLNRGMYDVVEVGQLVGRTPDTIVAWTSSAANRGPLLVPEHDGVLFSFLDLVSLDIASGLRRRGVSLRTLVRAHKFLSDQLGTHRPLAHAELATAGSQIFANLQLAEGTEWVDAGRWGQRAFESMLRDDLRPFEYGADHLARRWVPRRHIALDPAIQAGAPCVENTRVPTRVLWELRQVGEDVYDLADDYELPVEDVRAAIEWERKLQQQVAA